MKVLNTYLSLDLVNNELSMVLDGVDHTTWKASAVTKVENLERGSGMLPKTQAWVDFSVVQQIMKIAYEAGQSKDSKQLAQIRQILNQ